MNHPVVAHTTNPDAPALARDVVRHRIGTAFDLLDAQRDALADAGALADRLMRITRRVDDDLGRLITALRQVLAELQGITAEAPAPVVWLERATVAVAMALSAAVSLHDLRHRLPSGPPPKRGRVVEGADERRTSGRAQLQVQVDLFSDDQFFVGYSEDLSSGGLFIATYAPLSVGTAVDLSIDLDEHESIETSGRVIWLRQASEDAPPGMAVALDRLDAEQRDTIEQFLRRRPPLFYDV